MVGGAHACSCDGTCCESFSQRKEGADSFKIVGSAAIIPGQKNSEQKNLPRFSKIDFLILRLNYLSLKVAQDIHTSPVKRIVPDMEGKKIDLYTSSGSCYRLDLAYLNMKHTELTWEWNPPQ